TVLPPFHATISAKDPVVYCEHWRMSPVAGSIANGYGLPPAHARKTPPPATTRLAAPPSTVCPLVGRCRDSTYQPLGWRGPGPRWYTIVSSVSQAAEPAGTPTKGGGVLPS